MTPSNPGNRDLGISEASKFLAARDRGFTASWCYAKITPAALHRGNFDVRGRGDAEAAGPMPKFELSDFAKHRRQRGATAVRTLRMV
jgi:hypothetical protein